MFSFFSFHSSRDLRDLHSFPTRRSSDLFLGFRDGLRRQSPVYRFLARVDRTRPALCRLEVPLESAPSLVLRIVNERSEEHTSELQSPVHLVCRLLLEKKKNKRRMMHHNV